ncbi:alpha/beta fold hydrolase [Motilibacter aurantiacus]|uniref:alpha/beta fold hydrolase n=1 Tax=Motilibacter aurantiacus TaxID=2714955 RepID=UPI002F2B2386
MRIGVLGGRATALGAGLGLAAAGTAVGVVAGLRLTRRAAVTGATGAEAGTGRARVVVTDDGVPLHVEVDEPAGPARTTVVLVHGFGNDLRAFHHQRRALRPHARLVLFDQRGHGRSGGTPDARSPRFRSVIDQLGADLARVLAETAPDGPVVLVGHSMGGMTVMALADRHPELFGPRVVAVALLSTSPGQLAEVTLGLPAAAGRLVHRLAPGVLRTATRQAELVERGRRAGNELSYALTRHYAFGGQVSPELVALVVDMVAATPVQTLAEVFPAFAAHDKLEALAVLAGLPSLVLVGERDLLTPVEHSRAIAERLPLAELVTVPDAGHMVLLERPAPVDEALLRLLDRAVPGGAR